MSIKNRIVEHIKVKAGALIPHPLNFRKHPQRQKDALAASYEEVGFARSLLGYYLPDGKIQLIDGHLRAEHDPDMEVTVEILDVTDEEARKLLLTIDPLAALAETDEKLVEELNKQVKTDSKLLGNFWKSLKGSSAAKPPVPEEQEIPVQFLILVECADEAHQVALLKQFHAEGLKCKALLS